MSGKGVKRRALRAAFPCTVPILTGFGFLGVAYGVYMNVSGFPFWYPMLTATVIFGGSLEFLLVPILLGPFAPVQTLAMALMVQARHLFYGIAMLDKYKGTGWKKPYLIFSMCDESFSVNCSVRVPPGVDRGWFYFFVSLLDQLYWVAAAALGGLLGSCLPFDAEGLDFVMTAMFVVILLEQLRREKRYDTALIGAASSAVCLVLFGAERFLLPAMGCILLLLTALRAPIEKAGGLS